MNVSQDGRSRNVKGHIGVAKDTVHFRKRLERMLLATQTKHHMCFNFHGVYISQISIFMDFAFLNSRSLAIVPCISIDV